MRSRLTLAFLIAVPLGAAPALAEQVKPVIPISVKMPLPVGKRYKFTFRLFDQEVGGTPLWEEVKSLRVPKTRRISHRLGRFDRLGATLPAPGHELGGTLELPCHIPMNGLPCQSGHAT